MKKILEEKQKRKKKKGSKRKKKKTKGAGNGIGLRSFISSQKGTSQSGMKFYE